MHGKPPEGCRVQIPCMEWDIKIRQQFGRVGVRFRQNFLPTLQPA